MVESPPEQPALKVRRKVTIITEEESSSFELETP
jgi:hypothetical protein